MNRPTLPTGVQPVQPPYNLCTTSQQVERPTLPTGVQPVQPRTAFPRVRTHTRTHTRARTPYIYVVQVVQVVQSKEYQGCATCTTSPISVDQVVQPPLSCELCQLTTLELTSMGRTVAPLSVLESGVEWSICCGDEWACAETIQRIRRKTESRRLNQLEEMER